MKTEREPPRTEEENRYWAEGQEEVGHPGSTCPAPSSSRPLVAVSGLCKSYGLRTVLKSLSLTLQPGEVLALFGANGAGKTTLIRILAALARPSAGWAKVAGFDVVDDGNEVRRRVGLVSHQPYLYEELTVAENLLFFGRMYDVPDLAGRIEAVLAKVGLRDRRRERVRTLSRGLQQRLALARALLHQPALLLLDEPETGLDEESFAMLVGVVQAGKASGQCTLLTTHNLERGLALSDRIAILAGGRFIVEERSSALTLEALRKMYTR